MALHGVKITKEGQHPKATAPATISAVSFPSLGGGPLGVSLADYPDRVN